MPRLPVAAPSKSPERFSNTKRTVGNSSAPPSSSSLSSSSPSSSPSSSFSSPAAVSPIYPDSTEPKLCPFARSAGGDGRPTVVARAAGARGGERKGPKPQREERNNKHHSADWR